MLEYLPGGSQGLRQAATIAHADQGWQPLDSPTLFAQSGGYPFVELLPANPQNVDSEVCALEWLLHSGDELGTQNEPWHALQKEFVVQRVLHDAAMSLVKLMAANRSVAPAAMSITYLELCAIDIISAIGTAGTERVKLAGRNCAHASSGDFCPLRHCIALMLEVGDKLVAAGDLYVAPTFIHPGRPVPRGNAAALSTLYDVHVSGIGFICDIHPVPTQQQATLQPRC
jgi:hypothetical protein